VLLADVVDNKRILGDFPLREVQHGMCAAFLPTRPLASRCMRSF
jgi:hypothetical protein